MLSGYILPFFGKVISPCSADGDAITTPDDERDAHFERETWVFAWLGFFMAYGVGEIVPRKVDPSNPRQYAPGDLDNA